MPRRKVPRRFAAAFSPEHDLPRSVEYIPYTHTVAEARRRLHHGPLVELVLAAAWMAVVAYELVLGHPEVPWLLGLMLVSLLLFAAWNVVRLRRLRRGHPSGAVWRYGLFLWPDALVVLPDDRQAMVLPIDSIVGVEQDRTGLDTGEGVAGRVVRITAVTGDGEPVSVTVDDLGAMPAPHLARTIERWRTGVDPELLARADVAAEPGAARARLRPPRGR